MQSSKKVATTTFQTKAASYKRIWKTKTIFNSLDFGLKAPAILCISRFRRGIQIFLKIVPAQEEHFGVNDLK